MVTPWDKALVALLVPLVALLLVKLGITNGPDTATLTMILTPIVVWLVPNKVQNQQP